MLQGGAGGRPNWCCLIVKRRPTTLALPYIPFSSSKTALNNLQVSHQRPLTAAAAASRRKYQVHQVSEGPPPPKFGCYSLLPTISTFDTFLFETRLALVAHFSLIQLSLTFA